MYKNPLIPKRQKTPTYQYTEAQLRVKLNDAAKDGMAVGMYIANATYAACMLLALRDVFGFGVKRMRRVFDQVQKLFSEKVEARITDTEILQTLKDELGIELDIKKPDGVTESAMKLFQELETSIKLSMVLGRR